MVADILIIIFFAFCGGLLLWEGAKGIENWADEQEELHWTEKH